MLNQMLEAEYDDDEDRYIIPDTDTPPSSPSIPRPNRLNSIPPRSTRERSQSVTTDESGPPSARPSGITATRTPTGNPETADQRRLRSGGSKLFAGSGDELLTGAGEYVMLDTSMVGEFSPARVAKAAKEGASSASDERERTRQRSDSLFTRSNDTKGEGREGRIRLPEPAPKPAQLWFPLPPSFEYGNPNANSSVSLPISVASSSSSATIRHDQGKGKRGLTEAERAELNSLSNKKADIDTKSLSLHLRARVVEILGCSEAMWEWVKEFQYRESEKEKKRKEQAAAAAKKKKVQGVGGGRVSYFHQDHHRRGARRGGMDGGGNDRPALRHRTSMKSFATGPSRMSQGDGNSSNGHGQGTSVRVSGHVAESPSSYSIHSFGSAKGDDPSERLEKSVKQELLRMTRERFDEVLSWFQL